MLKMSNSGFESKAVKLSVCIIVYNVAECCMAIYKPNLCCYWVWGFLKTVH